MLYELDGYSPAVDLSASQMVEVHQKWWWLCWV